MYSISCSLILLRPALFLLSLRLVLSIDFNALTKDFEKKGELICLFLPLLSESGRKELEPLFYEG